MLREVESAGEAAVDGLAAAAHEERTAPSGGDTLRLATRAMACEFAVLLNPSPHAPLRLASDALEMLHPLEAQMTAYRDHSELSRINRRAAREAVRVEPRLFELLLQAAELCKRTDGAFDPTSGPLIDLWRRCRREGTIPRDDEIAGCLERTGIEHVEFDPAADTVRFRREGVELNLGGIGKGAALDRLGEFLVANGLGDFLLYGGRSSVLARGEHHHAGGWPVGLRDPLFPDRDVATVLLRDCALSSSGTGVQHFRHGGRRYGHILDPRTGRPVEGMLSTTVLAPTAAEADALSTAFFVGGVEIARQYCDNHEGVAAVLVPPPRSGRRLEPVCIGVPEGTLFAAAF